MSWEWRHIEDPTDGWKRLRCPDKGKCMPIKTWQLRTDGWIWGYLAAFWVFGPSCYPGPEVSLAMNTNCLFVWLKMVTATLKGSLLSEFTLIIIYLLFHYFCLSFSLVNLLVCSFNYQCSLVSSISYPFFFIITFSFFILFEKYLPIPQEKSKAWQSGCVVVWKPVIHRQVIPDYKFLLDTMFIPLQFAT